MPKAKKPKMQRAFIRNLQKWKNRQEACKTMKTAKKPKTLRKCIRSLLNWENDQEAQHENGQSYQKAKATTKKLANLGKP